jgi:hypothetical protein
MTKNLVVWSLFGLAFVLNPALFACSSESEEDFTYSESQMKAVVVGEWQGSAEVDGETIAFTLSLEQASAKSGTQSIAAPAFQPQCGSRSFVKPARACISMSTMPVAGTIASEHPRLSGAIEGEAEAWRNLSPTRLRLVLEDGTAMSGSIEDQAVAEGGELWLDGPVGTFTLARP